MTLRRADLATRRGGEVNNDCGSRRISWAIDAKHRLNTPPADRTRPTADRAGPSGSLIEKRGGRSHSHAPAARQLIADRVGEMIARRELKHAHVRPEIEREHHYRRGPGRQATHRHEPV